VEERSELCGRAEEGNGIERFQSRGEGVREGPHRARGEFRMRRLEIVLVNIAGEVTRNIEMVFDEYAVDDDPSLIISELAGTPGFDLLTERLEIALNAVHAERQRVHNRKVLRVLRENWRKHAWDNVAKLELQPDCLR